MKRLCSIMTAVLLLLLGFGTAERSSPLTPLASDVHNAATGVVTLITGDRVEVPGAGMPPRITPAVGRASMPFRVATDRGRIRVVPGDAAALIAAGRVDERLFDVTTLLDFGYDDTRRTDLPLILQYSGTAHRTNAAEIQLRPLSSVNGAAVSVPKNNAPTWWSTTTRPERGIRTLDPGLARIWLNGKRRLALDRSTAQIGAPTAWQAGLTGSGVRVAVIDSGVDATHPDLAGKVDAAMNFTSEAAGDRHGHGTHVASTIAGTGAASSGRFRGVAPQAHLLDAKVCDADGYCVEDAILAAMQWAATDQHASVVNISLGGLDTPGVDPLEQAVNTLSARHGTLFVVAAGNSGPSAGTVSSPGSADAALTVGAVDRQDTLADFSGRGPRTGDGALKPDVTAPGTDIAAARAAGTQLGDIVEERYVKSSGTSMATPHVAGAAALLRQRHPDWSGEQIKAALMASARTTDGVGVFDQGAGRVEAGTAITQAVTAGPPSLSFGIARWPHDDDQVLAQTVTYRNTGSTEVTLDLSLRVTDASSAPAPTGLFAVSTNRLVLPPGGTGQATVTADTRAAAVPVGRYHGRLLATGAGTVVTTPLAVDKESEHYDVHITHLGRDGSAPASYVTYLDRIGDCGADALCGGFAFGSAEKTTVRLPAGRYTVAEFSTTAGRDDTNLLMRPVLDLRKDTSLTVDARRAKPVKMTAPRGSARLMHWDLVVARDVHRPGQVLFYSVSGDHTLPLYTADLGGRSASKDDMISFVRGRFAEPGPSDDYTDSPYEYGLAHTTSGKLFTGLELRPDQKDFATVQAGYAAVTSQARDVKTDHFALPANVAPKLLEFAPGFPTNRLIAKAPFRRTEYYLAKDLRWKSTITQGSRETGELDFWLGEDQWHVYQPGQTYNPPRWSQAVFGPNLRQPRLFANGDARGVVRQGDTLIAGIDMFTDANPTHVGEPKSLARFSQAKLFRDGTLVNDWPSFGYRRAQLPPQEATYKLEATVRPPFSQISTSVTSTWTFRSAHVGGSQAVPLPLLTVKYRPELDEHNRATPSVRYTIPVEVTRQPGAGSAIITELAVEASDDEGSTWRTASVAYDGTRWLATIDNPAGGSVSLRIRTKDTDGNQLEQTTLRAYLING